MRPYQEIWQDRAARSALLAGTIARLATQCFTIPIVFSGAQNDLNFAQTGFLVGCYAFGRCISAPFVGRLTDRLGMKSVISIANIIHAAAIILAALSIAFAGIYAFTAALFVVGGISFPPTSAAIRTVISRHFSNPEIRKKAFSLDSISGQLALIGGPLISSFLAITCGGMIVLIGAAIALLVASMAFLNGIGGLEGARPGRDIKNFFPRRLFVVFFAVLAVATSLGAYNIAIPAALDEQGAIAWTGFAFSLMALFGLGGTLCWSSLKSNLGVARRLSYLLAGLTISLFLFVFGSSVAWVVIVWAIAGVFLGPAYAAIYELTGDLAPAERKTEAFSWLVTASMLGNGVGAWGAGVMAEGLGASWTLILANSGCLIAAVLCFSFSTRRVAWWA